MRMVLSVCTRFPRLLESPGFFPKIFRTWKVLENEFGHVVQLNQHAFYVQNTTCK